jgi:hypothetical protein
MPFFAGQTREQSRRVFIEVWRKHSSHSLLEPYEAQIVGVISEHPEYVPLIESGEAALAAQYTVEDGKVNPFLHMGAHLALRDQLATDRPAGIAEVYQRLARRLGDKHAAEHAMIEVLMLLLWEASTGRGMPDENIYLERLKRLR